IAEHVPCVDVLGVDRDRHPSSPRHRREVVAQQRHQRADRRAARQLALYLRRAQALAQRREEAHADDHGARRPTMCPSSGAISLRMPTWPAWDEPGNANTAVRSTTPPIARDSIAAEPISA